MSSVLTALHVLEAVSERQPIGVTEVARGLGVPKSSAQRALVALKAAGWIRPEGERSPTRWVLTPRAFAIGSRAGGDLRLTTLARPVMSELRAQTRETINLMVPDGADVVLIERLDSPQLVRSSYPLGMRAPMNACSNGKAVLSAMSAERLEELLAQDLPARTPATVTDADRLRRELAETCEHGYATNHEELSADISAVAAAILDMHAQPVAAVSISVPTQRMTDELWDRHGRLVADAARKVSAALGYAAATAA
jgi:IclR family acetate operon transcriptional repressor